MSESNNVLKNYWAKYSQWRAKRKAKKEANKPQTIPQHLWAWTKTIVGAVLVVMVINGLLIASFVVPTGSMENTVMTGDFLFVNKFVYGPSTPQIVPFLNIPLPYYKFPSFSDPELGDVIVFIYPGDRDQVEADAFQYYLKRCLGAAGDTIQIINKKTYINGKEFVLPPNGRFISDREDPLDRYSTFPKGMGFTRDNYGPIRIPKKGDVIELSRANFIQWDTFIKREGHEIALSGEQVSIDGKPVTKYTVERDYCFGMGDNRDNSTDSRFWGFIPYDNVVGTPIMVYWSWESKDPNSLDPNYERPISEKIANIRWGRIFNFIK